MKILSSAAVILALSLNFYAMPLIFKVTKQTAGEIAVIDTTKYEKIRILATASDQDALCAVSVFGVEGKMEFILLRTPSFKPFVLNEVIDAPPAKIKLTAANDCLYSVFVYGV